MTLSAQLEALLFLAPEPVSVEELADALQTAEEAVAAAADELAQALEGRGLVLRRVAGADRATVAITLFALLELYKRGEAAWEQDEPFGEITVAALP